MDSWTPTARIIPCVILAGRSCSFTWVYKMATDNSKTSGAECTVQVNYLIQVLGCGVYPLLTTKYCE